LAIVINKFVILSFVIKVESKLTKKIIVVKKKSFIVVKSKSRTKVKSSKTKDCKLISELFVVSKTYSINFYCCFLLLTIRIIILEF